MILPLVAVTTRCCVAHYCALQNRNYYLTETVVCVCPGLFIDSLFFGYKNGVSEKMEVKQTH